MLPQTDCCHDVYLREGDTEARGGMKFQGLEHFIPLIMLSGMTFYIQGMISVLVHADEVGKYFSSLEMHLLSFLKCCCRP